MLNRRDENPGKIRNLVIDAADCRLVHAVLSIGGFTGMGSRLFGRRQNDQQGYGSDDLAGSGWNGKHDAAIPVNQCKLVEGKITLPGATKDAVKAMPAFEYAK